MTKQRMPLKKSQQTQTNLMGLAVAAVLLGSNAVLGDSHSIRESFRHLWDGAMGVLVSAEIKMGLNTAPMTRQRLKKQLDITKNILPVAKGPIHNHVYVFEGKATSKYAYPVEATRYAKI
jgi:hypothetical protein